MAFHCERSGEHAMKRPMRGWFLLVVGLLAGCGEDDRPATWTYVHAAIVRPNCTTSACHSNISAAAGLRFEDRETAYLSLTGQVCNGPEVPGEPPRNLVFPGDPERSKLMYLLRGEEVRNMPPDTPLPDVDIELIERWILQGAQCD